MHGKPTSEEESERSQKLVWRDGSGGNEDHCAGLEGLMDIGDLTYLREQLNINKYPKSNVFIHSELLNLM